MQKEFIFLFELGAGGEEQDAAPEATLQAQHGGLVPFAIGRLKLSRLARVRAQQSAEPCALGLVAVMKYDQSDAVLRAGVGFEDATGNCLRRCGKRSRRALATYHRQTKHSCNRDGNGESYEFPSITRRHRSFPSGEG